MADLDYAKHLLAPRSKAAPTTKEQYLANTFFPFIEHPYKRKRALYALVLITASAIVALVSYACYVEYSRDDCETAVFPQLHDNPDLDSFEPMGMTWLENSAELAVVSGSHYYKFSIDGRYKARIRVGDHKLRDIAAIPDRPDYLYFLTKGNSSIVEYDLVHKTERSWILPYRANYELAGLAYVADSKSINGGYFYVGDPYDGSVRQYDVPLVDNTTATAKLLDSWRVTALSNDIKGLDYKVASAHLYTVFADQHLVVVSDRNSHRVVKQFEKVPERGAGLAGIATTVFNGEDTVFVSWFKKGQVAKYGGLNLDTSLFFCS
eukprot:Colp12_sorted_trinity150504_noHs@29542